MNSRTATCIGLWLAEGDNKTHAEITFTNNCWPLVKLFSKTICNLFKNYNLKPRIYVYSKETDRPSISLTNHKIKYYKDNRARKPYFIFRIASVKATKIWKKIVKEIEYNTKLYSYILAGFFAGEGNIKSGSHSNRTLRIAQKNPNKFIENILKELGVSYIFAPKDRSYYITGKWNWDIFAKHKLADLHPHKREKFWKTYKAFKEDHYPNHYIKNRISILLTKAYSASELAVKFNRSQARICDVLMELKREKKIKNFRVGSKNYWIRLDQNSIILSDIKLEYLKKLNRKSTAELAKTFNVTWKSAYKHLNKLKELKLINIENKKWKLMKTNQKILSKAIK